MIILKNLNSFVSELWSSSFVVSENEFLIIPSVNRNTIKKSVCGTQGTTDGNEVFNSIHRRKLN